MRIECTQQGSVTVVHPRGMLAGADADELETRLSELADGDNCDVILEVSGIIFADSHGLEVLVDAAERLIRDGKTLRLAGENPKLREVLELTDLASLFEAHPTVELAMESCR